MKKIFIKCSLMDKIGELSLPSDFDKKEFFNELENIVKDQGAISVNNKNNCLEVNFKEGYSVKYWVA